MATKPMAWQKEELVNESWALGEVGAMISPDSRLQDKKAPRAEPEEDIDILEPDDPVETLIRTESADASAVENQESTRVITLCCPGESQKMVTGLKQVTQRSDASQTRDRSEDSAGVSCQDASPPPPPLLRVLSTEERLKRERLSSLEAEVDEWMSDGEIISDLMSPDSQISQEWPQTPSLTEPIDSCQHSTPEETTGDKTMTEKDVVQPDFLPDGNKSDPENDPSPARVNHSPTDRNSSDDVYSVHSPPFADESEEEEEGIVTSTPCQQQCSEPDINSSVSSSTHHPAAVPAEKQQKELLDQSKRELAPRGRNQEAAQQVLSQDSPPLSTVAMEPTNQGVEAFKASGCVVAVREMHNRAGGRTEGESKQIGGQEGQKEFARERYKTVGLKGGTGVSTVQTQEVKIQRHRFVFSKHRRMASDSSDDSQSDSGVSTDFSPSSTMEVTTTVSPATAGAAALETPIEREIRRSIEREHSLRRARGFPNPSNTPEYVEIPLRKTVLQQSLVANTEKYQGKDRMLAGKKMQQEIHVEVQREQDLVKLGKVPGFYDKGTVRQLKERKQLFEAFQQASDSTLTSGKAMSWSYSQDDSSSSKSSTIGGSYAESSSSSSSSSSGSQRSEKGECSSSATAPGRRFSEVIIRESSVPAQNLHHHNTKVESFTTVDGRSSDVSSSTSEWIRGLEQEEEEDAEVTPKENPFFKLRTSTNLVKVEQDIREAREREKELHRQRLTLYGGTESAKGGGGRRGGRPASIDGKSSTLYSCSVNGLPVPDSPGSVSRRVTGPPAVRQSVGKIGVWPPAQAEEEKINRPEVQHSPRTPRQKNAMVQRWEAGLVNGHNEGDH